MLYCCGGRQKREDGRAAAAGGEALMSGRETDAFVSGSPGETPPAGMFDTTDMPELLPASEGEVPPSSRDSDSRAELKRDCVSPDSPQRRLGQRAPKLGQIGRSKRVVIEDDDLDNIMNNNSEPLPVTLSTVPS